VRVSFDEALATLQAFMASPEGLPNVQRFVELAADTLARGGKLLACGTAAELRHQVGAGADVHLDMVFRTLVHASDPVAVARSLLG